MTSVGQTLRNARESQKKDLAQLAEALCITKRYLVAIEADDLKVLPGFFFYKAFVRQYAEYLKLDPKRFDAQLKSMDPAAQVEPVALKPEPKPIVEKKRIEAPRLTELTQAAATAVGLSRFVESPVPDPLYKPPVRRLDPLVAESNKHYFDNRRIGFSAGALVLVLVACSGFYAWWNRPHTTVMKEAVPSVPVRAVSDSAALPSVDVVHESDGVHVALNLSATEPTWVSVTSGGKEVFSGILEPSQSKTLTGLDAAKMKVGNAGGVAVLWNGKSIGPIGERGQVRTVMFTPQNYEILQPVKEAPPATPPAEPSAL
jgi:cytoskeletal protein RodZ